MTGDQFAEPGGAFGAPFQAQGVAPVAGDGQGVDVVGGGAPGDRVGAAGVVADHAADGAAAVRGGVRAEGQPVRCGGGPQVVQDDARLDHGGTGAGVEFHDGPQMPGEVEDDAGAGGLPGDGRTAAARDDGHLVGPADGKRGGDVVGVARGDYTERDPAVVGGVHRRQGPRGGVERDLAPYGRAQFTDEPAGSAAFRGAVVRSTALRGVAVRSRTSCHPDRMPSARPACRAAPRVSADYVNPITSIRRNMPGSRTQTEQRAPQVLPKQIVSSHIVTQTCLGIICSSCRI